MHVCVGSEERGEKAVPTALPPCFAWRRCQTETEYKARQPMEMQAWEKHAMLVGKGFCLLERRRERESRERRV